MSSKFMPAPNPPLSRSRTIIYRFPRSLGRPPRDCPARRAGIAHLRRAIPLHFTLNRHRTALACSRLVEISRRRRELVEEFLGSSPKNVMALEALWMLELARRRGFSECAQCHVSTLGVPENIKSAIEELP